MGYKFPKITHISQVIAAIAGREEFQIKVDETYGYTVINYIVNFEDTFPPVKSELDALCRECRGITFDTATGKVIARKYHKFFNIGERPETLVDNIDWSRPYRRFKKLDGSMMSPLLINGEIRWATKRGLTEVGIPVDEWTSDKPQYSDLCKQWIAVGWTPIFEWCSRRQTIVVDYPDTNLILTAIRHNEDGHYLTADQLRSAALEHGIPCAEFGEILTSLDPKCIQEIIDLVGEEGDVFRFEDGHMFKQKGEWYSNIHRALEHFFFEKDVIRLILDEKIDDVKPFILPELASDVDAFTAELFAGLRKTASDIYWDVQASYDKFNGGKKRFADHMKDHDPGLIMTAKFKAWDIIDNDGGEDEIVENLIFVVKKHVFSQTRINTARILWGDANWKKYLDKQPAE